MRVLILGAGGHAQVVADILLQMREAGQDVTPLGYLDDKPQLLGQRFLGLPVLGATAELSTVAHDAIIIAIGDNAIRRQVFERMQNAGELLAIACHPRSIVAPGVAIGPGSMICAGVVINPGTVIGSNVILNTGCTIDHHNRIGSHVHIAPGVHLGGDVAVDEGTLVGIGSTVIPQRSVGAWAIVGAGSVVTKDVPDLSVAAGVPARIIRRTTAGT